MVEDEMLDVQISSSFFISPRDWKPLPIEPRIQFCEKLLLLLIRNVSHHLRMWEWLFLILLAGA